MTHKVSCDNCNDGKIGYERNSGVKAICEICHGTGWYPDWWIKKFQPLLPIQSIDSSNYCKNRGI